MTETSIVILGLPASGKTTYLAALWHVLMSRELVTELKFDKLPMGDVKYLNRIAERWRDAYVQGRTALSGTHIVKLLLKDPSGEAVSLTFPDAPGEEFRDMWELRQCEPSIIEHIRSERVVLFIHADRIEAPRWVVDENRVIKRLEKAVDQVTEDDHSNQVEGESDIVDWTPKLAPTQVQLVGLLQLLAGAPLTVGPRRLAVVFSAWDLVADNMLTPEQFLAVNLPLLDQFLRNNANFWDVKCYGISAQGSKYDKDDQVTPCAGAIKAREHDLPSNRIKLVDGAETSSDLTRPLNWLLEKSASK